MAVQVSKRLFTTTEYHQMAQAGILNEDDRVELIEGEVVDVPPISSRHAACVNRLNHLFSQRVGDRALVSVQNPIHLSDHSEPQPDLALLKPRGDLYDRALPEPNDVLLLVEVAESSVEYDRQEKIPLYARAGIREVWLVDLSRSIIELYRQPSQRGYRQVQSAQPGQKLSPELLAEVVLELTELLR